MPSRKITCADNLALLHSFEKPWRKLHKKHDYTFNVFSNFDTELSYAQKTIMSAFYLNNQEAELALNIYNNGILTYLRVKLLKFLVFHYDLEALYKKKFMSINY